MSNIINKLKEQITDPRLYIKYFGKTSEGFDIYTTTSDKKICIGAQVFICNNEDIIEHFGGIKAFLFLAQQPRANN